ncbi:hypothetical protein [Thermococcus stetteri]|uniref:hypothetical protein n=1 Tax=Thermococcus stetteri TaxID=49900 RepID=UPI001AE78BF1|nr:hypothetical protein [Thermococcus stetteri]MBP1911456.1 hypothetical protein [Thermococcus stetteri]
MPPDDIIKTLESWDAKSLVAMAQEDESILATLIHLLDEDRFQLRVLALLEELLPSRTNREIYKKLFPRLLLLLTKDRKTAVKAARVMKVLLTQEPPTKGDLRTLLKIMLDTPVGQNDPRWLELADVADKLPLMDYRDVENVVLALMESDNPSLKLVGLKFAKSMSGIRAEDIIKELSYLMTSENPLIVDRALDFVLEILTSPIPLRMEDIVRYLYSLLKALTESAPDAIMTSKARKVFSALVKSAQRYYSLRPTEARESARRLRKEGLEYEAIFIEELVGQPHTPVPYGKETLKMLAEDTSDLPDFLKG